METSVCYLVKLMIGGMVASRITTEFNPFIGFK